MENVVGVESVKSEFNVEKTSSKIKFKVELQKEVASVLSKLDILIEENENQSETIIGKIDFEESKIFQNCFRAFHEKLEQLNFMLNLLVQEHEKEIDKVNFLTHIQEQEAYIAELRSKLNLKTVN